ncbi:flagellar protein FlaG [Pseudomonas sp. JM0905a]|uniref:flagellar protein FlaG n=1 Tax=Pseudomonas sp. JM0905a TaxID=2772484 RepID=UPI0016894D38|nr:flagellar protein FlaG [Pseudomonas sp. JM0905a]MBD2837638.1 flagellar protein FlaG [Pseudomonas sp. JM0905a]
MDINVQGVRSSGVIDIGPAAEQKSQRSSVANARFNERELPFETIELAGSSEDKAETIGDTVASLQEFAQSIQRDLSFRVDDSSGRIVVEVRDQSSGEVIRQIPSEEALQLLKHLEEARSLMLNTTA